LLGAEFNNIIKRVHSHGAIKCAWSRKDVLDHWEMIKGQHVKSEKFQQQNDNSKLLVPSYFYPFFWQDAIHMEQK